VKLALELNKDYEIRVNITRKQWNVCFKVF